MKRVTSDQQATGIFNGFKDWSCTVSSQNLHSDSDSDSESNFDRTVTVNVTLIVISIDSESYSDVTVIPIN